MDSIEQYFQKDYIIEKNKIKEIDDLLKDVFKTLCVYNENKEWPYEINKENNHNNNFSFSTTSMILFVIGKLLNLTNLQSSIIPNIKWDVICEKSVEDKLKECYSSGIAKLTKECKTLNNEKKRVFSSSNSFGNNDPFTLSWIAELMDSKKDKNSKEDKITSLMDSEEDIYTLKEKFLRICIDKIGGIDEKQGCNILDFNNNGIPPRKSSNHIFTLLSIIHLYKTIKNIKVDEKEEEQKKIEAEQKKIEAKFHTQLYKDIQNRINQQISFYYIQNNQFDTAELVLSIEALFLIDEKRVIDENMLKKSFDILKKNQEHNLYWRPLKPFVTSPQGDILLPLSIEIANSLLRICRHLEKFKKHYFDDFFEIFDNYTKWLLANISQCTIGDTIYKGWHSEHIQDTEVIHPWETAQVIIYLMNFKTMLQERIAYKSLTYMGLSCNDEYQCGSPSKIDIEGWKKWEEKEPLLGMQELYKDIREKYLQKRIDNSDAKWSMLLYGPPGTGKSSVAEQLAKSLNWRLITITPSDFIKYGESDIEGRAKNIFKTLEEQKDCVILFDEIDRLILDRDSDYYSEQSDMFQFMTPSMLVKIRELRKRERSIFIIATNYEERIDSAIKRTGRIDEKYLINPPNFKQRKNIISELSKDEKIPIGIEDVDKLASGTVFYTYGELETLVRKIKTKYINQDSKYIDSGDIDRILKEEDKPTIKLSTYFNGRIKSELNKNTVSKFPVTEFFYLVFLYAKVGLQFSDTERNFITKLYRLLKEDTTLRALPKGVMAYITNYLGL
jgi:hypothetical protein